MKINNFLKFLLVLLILGLSSCEKEAQVILEEDSISDSLVDNLNETNLILKDITLLLGKVLQDDKIREEVNRDISEVDKYGEIVSFSYLLGNEKGINKRESKILKSGSNAMKQGKNSFSNAISKELLDNLNSYKYLAGAIENRNINLTTSKSEDGMPQDLSDLFASHNIEIYLPYEDTDVSEKEGDDFYVTFRPDEYVDQNEAFQYSGNDSKTLTLKSVGFVDNDFIDANRVYVVGVMDDCDTNYARCNYNDLDPYAGGGDPDPLPSGPVLLDYNVDHASVEEKDILTTRFSGFKVDGNDWLGFGATHQKLDIYRGSPDGKITISGGNITAESKSYNVGYFRIRAKGARKGWWYDVNEEFDDDWNVAENEQAITVFTKHHLSASASVKLKTKAGLKLDDGEIKPTLEATLESEVSITVGAAKQRTRAQLSRRQVLSTIVGNGVTGKTRDGTDWNAKKSSIFHYYFKHYYTDL